jgi:hypothetical protein
VLKENNSNEIKVSLAYYAKQVYEKNSCWMKVIKEKSEWEINYLNNFDFEIIIQINVRNGVVSISNG